VALLTHQPNLQARIAVPETDAEQAGIIFDRVRGKLAQIEISLGRSRIRLSFSCGVATFRPEYLCLKI
jgi:PleD family two-component response regulator